VKASAAAAHGAADRLGDLLVAGRERERAPQELQRLVVVPVLELDQRLLEERLRAG
jgi:hypothetical protein